jgi:hypothetical protein
MEEEPFEPPGFPEFFIEGEIPVFVIPQDGIPQAGQVAADLVGTAGTQFQFQKGKPVPVFPQAVGGFRLLDAPFTHKILPNNPHGGIRLPGAEGEIELDDTPVWLPRSKQGGKPGGGFPVFRHHDKPGGILIKAVY